MADLPPINSIRSVRSGVTQVGSRLSGRTNIPPTSERLRRKIREGLEGYTKVAAAGLATAGDTWSAEIWDQVGPDWADAVAELAMINNRLRKILDRAVEGGTYGAVLTTSICLAAPLVANYMPGLPARVKQSLGMLPVAWKRIDPTDYFTQMARINDAMQRATNGATATAA